MQQWDERRAIFVLPVDGNTLKVSKGLGKGSDHGTGD